MSLEGLVGNTNYDSSDFTSNTAYQFSQFLENQANSLDDTSTVSTSPAMTTDPTITIDSGETIDEALDLGIFDGNGSLITTDGVGSSDLVDLYEFSIGEGNDFNFVLDGLSADADLRLVDSNGEILAASENLNTDMEILTASLPAGTYFLGVASHDNIDTSYNLSVFGGENALTSSETQEVVDPTLATTDLMLI
ncbi:MAG: PPC domain-containing protein [Waterburya sp.]